MNTFVRFFIKGSQPGRIFFDMPMPPEMNLPMLMHAVRTDGYIISNDFFIPYSQIQHVATYAATQQAARVVPFLVPDPEKPA